MADKKGKTSTVKASSSNTTSRSTSGVEADKSLAEVAANAQGKTLVEVAPLTSDGKGTAKAKPSSTLAAGKTLNEVRQAELAKLQKAASSRKGSDVGETIFSKKPAAAKAEAKPVAKAAKKAKPVVKAEARPVVKEESKVSDVPSSDPLSGREA